MGKVTPKTSCEPRERSIEDIPCMAPEVESCSAELSLLLTVKSWLATAGAAGGAGGDSGGSGGGGKGKKPHLVPQLSQSVPRAQSLYSLPGPPSLHVPSGGSSDSLTQAHQPAKLESPIVVKRPFAPEPL